MNRQHNGQQFEDTKGISRIHKSKDRQHNGQKFDETKEVIRSHKLKDRQRNGQMLKDTKGVIIICRSKIEETSPVLRMNIFKVESHVSFHLPVQPITIIIVKEQTSINPAGASHV